MQSSFQGGDLENFPGLQALKLMWKPEKASAQHSTSNALCLLIRNFDV